MTWFFHRFEITKGTVRFYSSDAWKWWVILMKENSLGSYHYILALSIYYFARISELGNEMLYCHLYLNINNIFAVQRHIRCYIKHLCWNCYKTERKQKTLRTENGYFFCKRVYHRYLSRFEINCSSCIFLMSCKRNEMKISSSRNLLKCFSAFSVTNNNISLIPCNSHKNKIILKNIYLQNFG